LDDKGPVGFENLRHLQNLQIKTLIFVHRPINEKQPSFRINHASNISLFETPAVP